MPEHPAWARWTAPRQPWTVGAEEELMLLDARTFGVVNRVDHVLAVAPEALRAHASPETHACVVEIKTAPHPTVAGVARELGSLRAALLGAIHDRLDLRLAAAGTHPLAVRSQVVGSTGPHYRELHATMGVIANREPTMALHVHVAVPSEAAAIAALDGLQADLPLLLALSANSPFWLGEDSGFASIRIPILSMFPRMGIARRFGTYARYVEAVDGLLRAGAIADPSFVWWDARLQPRLGTVEIRIMDACSSVADIAALVALVQCRVRHHATAPPVRGAAPEIVAENRFVAARDGIRARLIDHATGRRRPARDILDEVVEQSRPLAAELGCGRELEAAILLAEDPGWERQREIAARDGVREVPAALVAEFTSAARAGTPISAST